MDMNKPVAWMALNELNGSYSTFTDDQKQRLLPHISQCYGKWIPLYTHTVKELTDEEKEIVTEALLMIGFQDSFINYDLKEKALAILRKAQEK